MPITFRATLQELIRLNEGQAMLFMFGPGLTLATQQSLKPKGHCGERMHDDYQRVQELAFFFVFCAYASFAITSFVKNRIPDGAGLQGLDAVVRKVMRALAGLGYVLNVAASVLAVCSYTAILQAKLGKLECLPLAVRAGVYGTYVVVGFVLSVVYLADGRAILLAQE